MKFSLALLFVFFLSKASWSQSIMTFERIFVKVDSVSQNGILQQKIKFLNTGNKPLVITKVTSGHEGDKCTFSSKAVAPGKEGYITYQPESGFCGKYTRNLTVETKDGEKIVLYAKGVVVCEKVK